MKTVGVLLVLAGVTGCSQFTSGETQTVVVDTQPQTGAMCVVQNARGSWAALSTPASVTLVRSTTPLNVSCRTSDNWTGGASFESGFDPIAITDGVASAGYLYPDKVSVTLAPPVDERPHFGADGGRGIRLPIDPMADQARMADDNVITRFQTLRVLLDEGLITRDEYNTRRGANLGTLLRYSVTPGARELTRATPSPQTIVQRLRYLAAAYAEHSISAGEQAAERAVILDGLLPSPVRRRADPPPPVTDDVQLATEIGRIERLRVANVITDAEAVKEKAKAAQVLDASIAASDAAARAAAGMAATPVGATVAASGIGVALSTHNSEAQARRAWAALQKAHPTELGQLGLSLKKIPRPHRPTHYQIVAGPLADRDTAVTLCKSLRKHDLFCDAAAFGE